MNKGKYKLQQHVSK